MPYFSDRGYAVSEEYCVVLAYFKLHSFQIIKFFDANYEKHATDSDCVTPFQSP